ncbi:hypothetical protein CB0940_10183 [Cercospora beticola]|uniref:Apple domain-containing protein n=1 Tax=Cercospora beticola TaxID=122368 RepID=A0A2G5HTF1_CERBT|nr:hypothetical protein CB0940_10183 [Cercospora beticola]PIA95810.1 hypothetical protein CB0940_10183 [Cercospora beticola]WPB06890.1 hypothetical protein RHO25_011550 [Cercospora beticola]CAK1366815.1 unnamed protein product [Cercospora beticola]
MRSRHALFSQAFALLAINAFAQSNNNYTCPSGNGTVYKDTTSDVLYVTRCGDEALPIEAFYQLDGVGSANDCWAWCSNNTACTGWTFRDAGTCYYKGVAVDGSPPVFAARNNPRLTSAIKLASYAPQASSYTCPFPQDRTVVNDANTGLPYVMRCGYDTYGTSYATNNATSSFNDCFAQCTSDSRCTTFTFTGGNNAVGPGVCVLKSSNPAFWYQPTPFTPTITRRRAAGIQLQAYNASSNGEPFFPPVDTTVYPPAATQIATQVILVTTTILQPVPTTILSTISRLTTITSSVTVTATNIATLPDSTRRITSLQVVPTTFATLQVVTITVTTLSTQAIVTVVPTTIIQALPRGTQNVLATRVNTATTVRNAVVTVTPVRSAQQTVTVYTD